jgi:hypothetical protein
MPLNLTIPHDIIAECAMVHDIDRAVRPLLAYLDPENEHDLGGEAGVWFHPYHAAGWRELTADQRIHRLTKFAEHICATYRND